MPTHFEVPPYLDYLAVFTWALSGAILGVSKGYDLTGVFVVALLSSVGGSMLRDGIFLNQPPPVVTNPYYLPLILLVTVLVGLFSRLLVTPRLRRHTDNLVDVIDAIGTVGLVAHGSTPQEMLADQKAEFERWGPLVKQIGFTAES